MRVITFDEKKYFHAANVSYQGVCPKSDRVEVSFNIPNASHDIDAVGLGLLLAKRDDMATIGIDLECYAVVVDLIVNVAFNLASFIKVNERNNSLAAYTADAMRQFLNEEGHITFERKDDEEIMITAIVGHERASVTVPLNKLADYLVAV